MPLLFSFQVLCTVGRECASTVFIPGFVYSGERMCLYCFHSRFCVQWGENAPLLFSFQVLCTVGRECASTVFIGFVYKIGYVDCVHVEGLA